MFCHHHCQICSRPGRLVNSSATVMFVDLRMSLTLWGFNEQISCWQISSVTLVTDGQFVDLLLKTGVCCDFRPTNVKDGLKALVDDDLQFVFEDVKVSHQWKRTKFTLLLKTCRFIAISSISATHYTSNTERNLKGQQPSQPAVDLHQQVPMVHP